MKPVARKHHFVPQCYLKGFTKHREKPKLFVVDLKRRNHFETAPENVAAIRDFHSIEAEGHPIDAIESGLADFESELAKALARTIAANEIQSEEDRIYLLNLSGIPSFFVAWSIGAIRLGLVAVPM
ncbi:DUF4238 domain-containing protein [Siccirubricoccus phaeus]|uniref:DUF4238 domain-containing protein n=1 Tax=Siccirubricoccus phaeus TaxID=2595053 RepID=UPI00165BBF88|nr:DUF4238 domain-containing protein [Siccirubricoccus phaeus]